MTDSATPKEEKMFTSSGVSSAGGTVMPSALAVFAGLRMTEIQRNFYAHRWEDDMTAFNIVRFRVKPGHQEQFIRSTAA
jgi:hypothetical protein